MSRLTLTILSFEKCIDVPKNDENQLLVSWTCSEQDIPYMATVANGLLGRIGAVWRTGRFAVV